MRSIGKTALALTVSLMIASGPAMATPAPVVKGDPQAWAEIETALLKLTHVRSYRVKGWFSGPFDLNLGGAVEVVNPDRTHGVLVGSWTSEGIQVGNDIRSRGSLDSSSGDFLWRCEQSTSGLPAAIDFLTLLGMNLLSMSEVTAASGPAAVVDGIPTQSYTYTYKPAGWWSPGSLRLFVADATGFPKRIQWLGDQGEVGLQADFSDYDAPITIVLPECRK